MTTPIMPTEVAQMDEWTPYYAIAIIIVWLVIYHVVTSRKQRKIEREFREKETIMELRKNNAH